MGRLWSYTRPVEMKMTCGRPSREARSAATSSPRVGAYVMSKTPSKRRPLRRSPEARVVLAVAGDRRDARGQALGALAAVEDRDLVAAREQLAHQMQADELGAGHDEHPHDARILT